MISTRLIVSDNARRTAFMPVLYRMKKDVGRHHLRGMGSDRVLSPGDEIRCEPEDLGGVLDKFEVIEPDTSPPEPEAEPTVGLVVVPRDDQDEDAGFDVINGTTGQRLNDESLTEEEADALATRMTDELFSDAQDEKTKADDGDNE